MFQVGNWSTLFETVILKQPTWNPSAMSLHFPCFGLFCILEKWWQNSFATWFCLLDLPICAKRPSSNYRSASDFWLFASVCVCLFACVPVNLLPIIWSHWFHMFIIIISLYKWPWIFNAKLGLRCAFLSGGPVVWRSFCHAVAACQCVNMLAQQRVSGQKLLCT